MKYTMIPGRWQTLPPHSGHIALIETVLKEGKSVWIIIRNTPKDKDNPYTVRQRGVALRKVLKKWGNKVVITSGYDIEDIAYGRSVGFGIREIKLPKEIEEISGTKIRENEKRNL